MRKNRKKGHVWLLGFLILVTLFLIFASGKRGFLQQVRVNRRKKQLEKEILLLQAEKERLEKEKEDLDSPEKIEKIAREKYGMAKEGEKVYRVVPAEK